MTASMPLLLFLSGCLLVWTGIRVTGSIARRPADAFWCLVIVVHLQIGAIVQALSLIHSLHWYGFLCCQGIVALAVYFLMPKKAPSPAFLDLKSQLTGTERLLILMAAAVVLVHFLIRLHQPIFIGDVLNYHASRPLYWMQHQTIAAYPTMNDRQTVFAFGADLLFLWPILFAKTELFGRMTFWCCFPLTGVGVFLAMRAMNASRAVSLLGANIILTLPIVFFFGLTMEPMMWVAFFALATCYWSCRLVQNDGNPVVAIFGIGISAVLAGSMKNTGMALIPGGVLVIGLNVLACRSPRQPALKSLLRSGGCFAAALAVGLLFSGLGFLLVQNLLLFGNPLSSQGNIHNNIAEFSPYQVYVHSARLAATFMETAVPILNGALAKAVNTALHLIRADIPLPEEMATVWIGHYHYPLMSWPYYGTFGLAGLFTIAITATLAVRGLLHLRRPAGAFHFGAGMEKAAFAIPGLTLLLGTTYLLRWIGTGTRSFLAPGMICIITLALTYISAQFIWKPLRALIIAAALCFWTAFLLKQASTLDMILANRGFRWDHIRYTLKRPHTLVENHVPSDATLVMMVDANFQDYTVFGPGYTRRIYQLTGRLDGNGLSELQRTHPGGYLLVIPSRYPQVDDPAVKAFPGLSLVAEDPEGRLYKIEKAPDA